MKKDIILFGIQWSGKGTQAKLLLEKIQDLKYFEPGNILRALKSNSNVIGDYIKACIEQGKLVENEILFGLFDMYWFTLKAGGNMLLDWFPRTMAQMDYFLNTEKEAQRDFVAVLYDLTREKTMERILHRASIEWRKDDTEEAIKIRLDTYEKETAPMINHLDSLGKVIHIDADQSIEKILEDTIKALEQAGAI